MDCSPRNRKDAAKGIRITVELLYIDQHISKESKTRQKGICGGPTKLDNRLSQNVQDNLWNHKVYRENNGKFESRTDSRKKKLNWGENPERERERDLPGRWAITITFCNSGDPTQSHT